MTITVIGKGAWGTALHSVLAKQKNQVEFWDRKSKITSEVVVLAVPTQAIREVLPFVVSKDVLLVNSSKGIEQVTHKLPYQLVQELLPNASYFSLMGPSFAQEVMDNMPTLVNLGFVSKEYSEDVKLLFQTDYFRVRLISGVEAIELASTFKNIYAVLAGIVEGLGFGVNTRIKIILMAFEEVSRLSKSLGQPIPEAAVSGIIGDLMLTCSSMQSRNYSFGKALVNSPVSEALASSKGVVEGWNSLESVSYFSKKTGQQLVLAELVLAIAQKATQKEEMKKLFLEYVKYI